MMMMMMMMTYYYIHDDKLNFPFFFISSSCQPVDLSINQYFIIIQCIHPLMSFMNYLILIIILVYIEI